MTLEPNLDPQNETKEDSKEIEPSPFITRKRSSNTFVFQTLNINHIPGKYKQKPDVMLSIM